MDRYTLHDTPAVVERIESDLDKIVGRLREIDPHLCSVILTGGFARGEGAVVDGQPQNDYDLVAVHEIGRPMEPYDDVRKDLELELGMHLDIARVARARLPWVPATIFWYETALRGRVVWGEDTIRLIRVRAPHRLRRGEAMRLLVNRAAGLLLSEPDDAARRLQASKALLAAMDVRLLNKGTFPPSQTERWHAFLRHVKNPTAGSAAVAMQDWFSWAYRMKVMPESTQPLDADVAWRAAASAVLDTIPVALSHGGYTDLEDYAHHDSLVARVHFMRHASEVPGAKRFAAHPTGAVRLATVRLLQAAVDGKTVQEPFADILEEPEGDTQEILEALRASTLQ